MSTLRALPPRPVRLSSKLRAAIEMQITKGMTIVAACEAAGISRAGYHKAIKRPAVRDFIEQTQRRFILDYDTRRAIYKAQALEVALDLLLNAKSEAIRARMAEFLASDAKVSPVSVHVDASQHSSDGQAGYTYLRPGEEGSSKESHTST